jgi:ankyrin repeat protein
MYAVILLLLMLLVGGSYAPKDDRSVTTTQGPARYGGRKEPFTLQEVATLGDTPLLKRILAKKPGKREKTDALFSACWKGYTEASRILVEHGADVNGVSYGETPLLQATRRGNLRLAAMLISKGARVRSDARAWITAASWCHTDVLALLIKHGARVNARDEDGKTALMWAAGSGLHESSRSAVELLLARGARLGLKDKRGLTAEDYARREGNLDTADRLRNLMARPPLRK